jgi:nucleotide-binding universal stress UspA family protein
MKHILLPTDFSDNSWNAIVYAIHFHEETNCHFYLLHVDGPILTSISPSIYGVTADFLNTTYVPSFKGQLKHLLNRISSELPKNKVHKFFTLSETGTFIETIRRQVQARNIEMIVMGTKGATGLKKLLIGSNAGDVITKVKCTTLIVPENAKFMPNFIR